MFSAFATLSYYFAHSFKARLLQISMSAEAHEALHATNTTVFVGVLTYNRMEYVKMHAMSLRATLDTVPWGERVHLWIFDDQSTEYGEKELREWYPMAEKVILRSDHMGVYVLPFPANLPSPCASARTQGTSVLPSAGNSS